MSANTDPKKPRCDSVLKNLPPDRQSEIFEYAKKEGLVKTVAWLKDDGVQTSKSAVGDFCSWYAVKEQKARNESAVMALLADLAKDNPTWTAEQLQAAGNAFFSTLAVQQQDTESWVSTQRLQLDQASAKTKAEFEQQKIGLRKQAEDRAERELKLQREKFQRETCDLFIKWSADQRANEITNSPSTNADKIERLGELMFGEDWKS